MYLVDLCMVLENVQIQKFCSLTIKSLIVLQSCSPKNSTLLKGLQSWRFNHLRNATVLEIL